MTFLVLHSKQGAQSFAKLCEGLRATMPGGGATARVPLPFPQARCAGRPGFPSLSGKRARRRSLASGSSRKVAATLSASWCETRRACSSARQSPSKSRSRNKAFSPLGSQLAKPRSSRAKLLLSRLQPRSEFIGARPFRLVPPEEGKLPRHLRSPVQTVSPGAPVRSPFGDNGAASQLAQPECPIERRQQRVPGPKLWQLQHPATTRREAASHRGRTLLSARG